MNDKFMQFVQEHVAAADENTSAALSIEQEKQRWLSKLNELGQFVDHVISSYVDAGIKTATGIVTIAEDQTGEYQAPQVEITVGQAVVKLKPVGTFLVGAWGRVDMEGPRGICHLVLVPKGAKGPLSAFSPESAAKSAASLDLVWKIMPPPPVMTYIELSRAVFLDMFMKVVRGG